MTLTTILFIQVKVIHEKLLSKKKKKLFLIEGWVPIIPVPNLSESGMEENLPHSPDIQIGWIKLVPFK